MTELDKDAIKRTVEQVLLDRPKQAVRAFFIEVQTRCKNGSIAFDWATTLEYLWHLARLEVVAVPGADIEGMIPIPGPNVCSLLVTERGKRLLEDGKKSPHDPPKYLASVRRRVTTPDDIAMTFLDEAVGAWSADLPRASAVMLGCACERLILILANQIVDASLTPRPASVEKRLNEKPYRISRVFKAVRECLNQLAGNRKIPSSLADALDRKLSAIFDHARGIRNDSGHPTGADVSREDAEAGLLLFPGFYELVNDLCQHLSGMEDSKATQSGT